MTATYRLHGLTVRSEIPMAAPTAATGAVDVAVRWCGHRPIPNAVPSGQLLAARQLGAGSWSVARHSAGYTVRLHGLCDFEIDMALRQIGAHLSSDRPRLTQGAGLHPSDGAELGS